MAPHRAHPSSSQMAPHRAHPPSSQMAPHRAHPPLLPDGATLFHNT